MRINICISYLVNIPFILNNNKTKNIDYDKCIKNRFIL